MKDSSDGLDHAFMETAMLIGRWRAELAEGRVAGRTMHSIDTAELQWVVAMEQAPLPPDDGQKGASFLGRHIDSSDDWMVEHIDTITEFAGLPASSVEAKIMKKLAQHWLAVVAHRMMRQWQRMIEVESLRRELSREDAGDFPAAEIAATA